MALVDEFLPRQHRADVLLLPQSVGVKLDP